jgi:hypothetical protein
MMGGFTVVFGGTKGGVPIFGLFTTEVIGGLTTGETGGLTTGGLGVPGITGGLTTGGLGVPGITGGLTTGVFVPPVILSITAFVVAPNAAPVKAVPNLLVVPVDFVTTGFAVGVTVVLVAGVVGVLDIAGFVAAVVFDVSAGFVAIAGLAPTAVLVAVVLEARGDLAAAVLEAIEGFDAVAAGFIPIGFDVMLARGPPMLVRGANAPEVVDVMGRDVTPPRDGNLPPPIDDCPPKLSPAKEEPSPRTTEVTGRPVDSSPRSRTPLGLRISRPRSPASKFTNGS